MDGEQRTEGAGVRAGDWTASREQKGLEVEQETGQRAENRRGWSESRRLDSEQRTEGAGVRTGDWTASKEQKGLE
jgi:hypothetical protein